MYSQFVKAVERLQCAVCLKRVKRYAKITHEQKDDCNEFIIAFTFKIVLESVGTWTVIGNI